MKSEVGLSLQKLRRAVARLEEIVQRPNSDVIRDATIQRFEFTFELLWKTLKMFLEAQGILAKSPKEALQEAFRLRWIRKEEVFLSMLDARNLMSHVYDEKEARAVAKEIRQRFHRPLREVADQLARLK
jgi:nucleotidyltransferase substrate binding protein (TIGR01987 family)